MKKVLWVICLSLLFTACGKKADEASSYDSMDYAAVDSVAVAVTGNSGDKNAGDFTSKGKEESKVEKKIIRTARISISSENLKVSKTNVDSLLKKFKGYYDSENYSNSYSLSYDLQIRIPSQYFDAFISELEKGDDKITEKDITAQDVTTQYIDLQSRIKTKRVYLERYNELAKKAKTVEDILKIEEQTRVIIEEIESSEQEFLYLSKQISLSTITITINQEKEYTQEEGPSFGKQLLSALGNGWDLLQGLFFFLITIWPLYFIIPIIIILLKRIKFKKKNKK